MGARPTLSMTSRRLEEAVRRSLSGRRVVLAVSGGRDSMVLLRAAARVVPRSVSVVATFDHGTGPAASSAASLVAAEAARCQLPVVMGHAAVTGRTEAQWRDARRAFLDDVARKTGSAIVTAHTRNDQVETVLMRVMRDAGARGLAGLYADGDALRPLLAFSRDDVTRYAHELEVPWLDDPTNESRHWLRNRLRHDLLPALVAADPALPDALLGIASDAARWRRRVDAWARRASALSGGRLVVAHALLAARTPGQLAVLWPALAARAGLAMDWRGTERVVAFTTAARVGSHVPLAGGWRVWRTREAFELSHERVADGPVGQALRPGMRWLGWRFTASARRPARRSADGRGVQADTTVSANGASDEWVALLPADAPLSVRRWQPGDRMRLERGASRRVKRFLKDAHVSGARRELWPVVLAGDEIIWIPGVRRSDAAAVRPGRPGVLYRCVPDYL